MSDCFVEGSFGTQLIGFSILIAMARTLLGGWPFIANLLSSLAMLLTVQLLWTMLCQYVHHQAVRLIGVALLLTAPSYLLISGSGFAEPLFTFFFTLCLYLYLRLQERVDLSASGLVLFVASGALMILAKKEGALLLLLILAFSVWGRRWGVALVSLGLLASGLLVFDVFEAASRHSADIGQSAFQLSYIARLLPAFGEAAVTPRYFGLLGLLTAPALLLAALSRERLNIQLSGSHLRVHLHLLRTCSSSLLHRGRSRPTIRDGALHHYFSAYHCPPDSPSNRPLVALSMVIGHPGRTDGHRSRSCPLSTLRSAGRHGGR